MREEAARLAGEDLIQYYAAFNKVGFCVLSRGDFETVLEEFFFETFDAFVGGEEDRAVAMGRFKKWLQKNFPGVDPRRVFHAVDSVNPYT